MCPYNTYQEVKRICGLEESVSEQELSKFIDQADQYIIENITIRVRNEVLEETDIFKMYITENHPIADINADSLIKGYEEGVCPTENADFHIYGWTNKKDPTTKTELEIDNSICDFNNGIIFLKSELSSDIEQVTIDYSYYPNEINWIALKHCAALYTGYLYLLAKYSIHPRRLRLGPLTVDYSARISRWGVAAGFPYEKLLEEFNKNWMSVLKKPFRKITREERKRVSVSTMEEMGIE